MKTSTHLRLALILSFAVGILLTSMARADVFALELEKALMSSDKIAAAHQSYLSAREDVVTATSDTDWSSNLVLDNKRRNQQTRGGDFTRSDSRNLTVNVNKKIYDGGVASAQKTVAMITLDLMIAQISRTEQTVLLDAIRAYIGLKEAQDRVAINRANLNRLSEYLKAANLQLALGEITPTDRAGARARHARANASLIQAENQLSSQMATYEALIGTIPAQLNLPTISIALPQTAAMAAQEAIQHHPSRQIAYLQERTARKTMDVLIAGIRPNLDLTLSGKSTDHTIPAQDTETYTATVQFTMPLFPTSSVYAKSRGAVADHREALFNLKDTETSTQLMAENAFRNMKAAEAVITAYQAEYDAAVIVRDGTVQEVQFGEKTLLDQLDAEQDVVTAELNLLISRHDRIDAIYSLLAAMGRLNAENLSLNGLPAPADAGPIPSPIMPFLPIIDYPE